MALIKCPECGKEVSSRATACPVCGFPIEKENPCGKVMIKIADGLMKPVKVLNMENYKTLWEGGPGQVAVFEVDGSTRIGVMWGMSKTPPSEYQRLVKAGERYALVKTERLNKLFIRVPEIVLTKVDTIDSDSMQW